MKSGLRELFVFVFGEAYSCSSFLQRDELVSLLSYRCYFLLGHAAALLDCVILKRGNGGGRSIGLERTLYLDLFLREGRRTVCLEADAKKAWEVRLRKEAEDLSIRIKMDYSAC